MTAREVVLEGGAPWGFRMHGGVDHNQPLRISRVNPGSKAAHKGVREGDLISSINGQNTKQLTNLGAHGLLKTAGGILKLGLNEDPGGSPKRRQYRNIHQESIQETVNKSSVTTYSISKTFETAESQFNSNNENSRAITGQSSVNDISSEIPHSNLLVTKKSSSSSSSSSTLTKEGDFKNTSSDHALASQRSSYTNCTISPSSPSLLSEDGTSSWISSQDNKDKQNLVDNMNDNRCSSRSKKRRQRRKNHRKITESHEVNTDNSTVISNKTQSIENKQKNVHHEEYTVQSPDELAKDKIIDKKLNIKPVKSKSLDDDDILKIEEVLEEKESSALVSEASEGEVDWEETAQLDTPLPLHGSSTTSTDPQEVFSSEQITSISPEEEKTLRDFLQSLNLVNGPEEAANKVHETDSPESIKQKKLKKKAELEQYFLPIYQNPRYLDVISEESSDRDSDREPTTKTRIIRKGTPEGDALCVQPKAPPRLNRERRKYTAPTEQAPAILLDTKLIDMPVASETVCSATLKTSDTSSSAVEVVYINSSESDSTEELESVSSDSYTLGSDQSSSTEDLSEKTLVNVTTDYNIHQRDHISKVSSEEISVANETMKTTASSKYTFTLKSDKTDKHFRDNISIDVLSQLTPPPTPDNVSPKEAGIKTPILNDHDYCNAVPSVLKTFTTVHTSDNNSKSINVTASNEIENRMDLKYSDKSNVTPPPPSRSRSSSASTSESSSRESSQCTVKYNPSSSSITDVLSLSKNEDKHHHQALTLREICLKFLLALPFGKDILKELADVSKCIESYTRSLPSSVLPKLVSNLAPFVDRAHSNNNIFCYNLSVHLPQKIMEKDTGKGQEITPNTESNGSLKTITKVDLNEAIAMEKIIPIRLESRADTDKGKCVNDNAGPIKIERENNERIIPIMKVNLNEAVAMEKIIPIRIDIDTGEDVNDNAGRAITIPIKIEKASSKNTERTIPIKIENEPKSEEHVNVLPAQEIIENKERIKITKSEKEAQILMYSSVGANQNTLLNVSPVQKNLLDKTKNVHEEADKLLELHEKFVNRRSSKELEEKVILTTNKPEPSSRLLSIIKEEPIRSDNEKEYLYFLEKDPNCSHLATLPRNSSKSRLDAKDLTEWLNLARNKSMSESNLTSVPDIPENNLRKYFNTPVAPTRRTSLPHDLYEKQMIYIQEKEREIQRQLEALEEEKIKLNADMAPSKQFHAEDYHFSRKGDFAESKRPHTSMHTEHFRQQMYEEYMDKFAEREERRQHKIIKVTSSKDLTSEDDNLVKKEVIHPIQIEDEFMSKVKLKQQEGKLEKMKSLENETEAVDKEPDGPPVLVIDGEKLKEAKELPKHLQEFIAPDGIWSPGQKIDFSPTQELTRKKVDNQDEFTSPIWTPKSANSSPTGDRKEFKPVNYQSPVLSRRTRTSSENLGSQSHSQAPAWRNSDYNSDTGSVERKLPNSRSTPATGFSEFSSTSRLPKAQNPTITLLQKAREGQLPKGASYIDQEPRQYRPKPERPPVAGIGEVLYQVRNEYTNESDNEKTRKMTDVGSRKFDGIGPIAKDGLPLVLRSEIKDENQSKWYKRMYDTIHKQKPHNDEYVTIRYKQKRAQYPYASGYLSEPEPGAYDSDFTEYKYQTLDRRRPLPQDRSSDYISTTMPRTTVNRSISSDIVRNTTDYYKPHPGRIENYTPGHSSISEKEAKQWWDEVMDIFDGWLDDNSALPSYEVMFARALSRSHLEQQKRIQTHSNPKSFINQALKESGYESDSTLIFRRKEDAAAQQLSPKEQRAAYKVIQKGGDVPLHGLRKPAPERPKESPRKYVENEVTIHYKTPVRQEIKEYLSEDELAHRQAEAMKKIYQEERRKKYLQELQDMNSRRHTDNFIPSQKSPISLNRYDDIDDLSPSSVKSRPRSPEPRLCARALYNFVGQTARELTFRKGDIIYLRRQIDKNWYEGELNAMVGLFPANYVEIVPFEGLKTKSTLRKAHEGQARAKYNFVAQTHLELSLAKGELVVVTRKVDENWYEGKIGGRKGIFPANYIEVLIEPQTPPPTLNAKPVASPAAHSLLLNGSSGGKESMGSHSYTPNLANTQLSSSYHAKPVHVLNNGSYGSLGKNASLQALHIETQSEPTPYRAMYKYNPQNDDELELFEGDTVYVLEKCDDGWYVGSSERTGAFGTFPGNYVEKI